jgi:hypothetical protein
MLLKSKYSCIYYLSRRTQLHGARAKVTRVLACSSRSVGTAMQVRLTEPLLHVPLCWTARLLGSWREYVSACVVEEGGKKLLAPRCVMNYSLPVVSLQSTWP